MTDRVMVDIETLGLNPGAAILSIGAVRFDGYGTGAEFEASVSLESCQAHGLEIDAGTLEWWLSQDDDAAAVLTGGMDLDDALADRLTDAVEDEIATTLRETREAEA